MVGILEMPINCGVRAKREREKRFQEYRAPFDVFHQNTLPVYTYSFKGFWVFVLQKIH